MCWFKLGVAVGCLMFASTAPVAKADLVAGDVAVIRIFTDNPDNFAWVAMVDISAGEQIKFTDAGWSSSGGFAPGEGFLTFTAPSGGVSAGSVFSYTLGTTDLNYTETGKVNLDANGDQVLVYQSDGGWPNFLYAAQTNSSVFQPTWGNSSDSELPPGLEIGTTAVAVGIGPGNGDEVDNAYYNGIVEGTREELLAAISDPANWIKFNYTPTAADFAALPSQFTVHGVTAVPEASSLLVGGFVGLVSLIACGVVGLKRRGSPVTPAG